MQLEELCDRFAQTDTDLLDGGNVHGPRVDLVHTLVQTQRQELDISTRLDRSHDVSQMTRKVACAISPAGRFAVGGAIGHNHEEPSASTGATARSSRWSWTGTSLCSCPTESSAIGAPASRTVPRTRSD